MNCTNLSLPQNDYKIQDDLIHELKVLISTDPILNDLKTAIHESFQKRLQKVKNRIPMDCRGPPPPKVCKKRVRFDISNEYCF